MIGGKESKNNICTYKNQRKTGAKSKAIRSKFKHTNSQFGKILVNKTIDSINKFKGLTYSRAYVQFSSPIIRAVYGSRVGATVAPKPIILGTFYDLGLNFLR